MLVSNRLVRLSAALATCGGGCRAQLAPAVELHVCADADAGPAVIIVADIVGGALGTEAAQRELQGKDWWVEEAVVWVEACGDGAGGGCGEAQRGGVGVVGVHCKFVKVLVCSGS